MVNLAEAASPKLQTAAAVEWFKRLRDELDNIRSAIDWLCSTGQTDCAVRGAPVGVSDGV